MATAIPHGYPRSSGCTIPATGPCGVASDDNGCTVVKEYSSIITTPIITLVQGHDDGFTVTWGTLVSHPNEQVRLIYRYNLEQVDWYFEQILTPRDTGTVTVSTLNKDETVILWLVAESVVAPVHGKSVSSQAIADASWDSTAKIVTFNGATVYFGDDIVVFTGA